MTIERLLDITGEPHSPDELYSTLSLPDPPANRPYTAINMAMTADGKIVVGSPEGTAAGVGGPTDQILFRRLQRNFDAAIIGARTLRAGTVLYPPAMLRFVVTATGDLPFDNRFFRDARDLAYVLTPVDLAADRRNEIHLVTNIQTFGERTVDLTAALRWMRKERGVKHLLCEGGSALNDQMLRAALVDELFLTVSNKIKGGAGLPTPVGGSGFPPGEYAGLESRSVYRDGGELYLRYAILDPR